MSIVVLYDVFTAFIVIVGIAIYVGSYFLKNAMKKLTTPDAKTSQPTTAPQSDTMAYSEGQYYSDPKPFRKKGNKRQHRQKNNVAMDFSAEGTPSVEPFENDQIEPIAEANDVSTESNYAFNNLDDAKRAIVYYEILKPKF